MNRRTNQRRLSALIVSEPGIDGVFRHVEMLCDFLLESKIDVDLAYSSNRSCSRLHELVQRIERSGGQTFDIKTGNRPALSDFLAYNRLKSFIKARCPDIIHAHSSKAGALTRLMNFDSGITRLYTPNAYYGMGARKSTKTLFFDTIERHLGKTGTTINCSPEESEYGRAKLEVPSNKQVEIPNGVNFSKFIPAKNEKEKSLIRAELEIPGGSWVIGSIGRLSYQKDPQTLYRAFAQFASDAPGNSCLLHVGSGRASDEAELNELANQLGISDRIIRPTYRNDPEVFYRAMDAFCLSSRYEGLPYTALEALAANLPLVLTDAPGMRSFGDNKYGFSAVHYGALNCPKSLASAMNNCYNQRSIPINHRNKAREHFSSDIVHERILKLYQRLSSHRTDQE